MASGDDTYFVSPEQCTVTPISLSSGITAANHSRLGRQRQKRGGQLDVEKVVA